MPNCYSFPSTWGARIQPTAYSSRSPQPMSWVPPTSPPMAFPCLSLPGTKTTISEGISTVPRASLVSRFYSHCSLHSVPKCAPMPWPPFSPCLLCAYGPGVELISPVFSFPVFKVIMVPTFENSIENTCGWVAGMGQSQGKLSSYSFSILRYRVLCLLAKHSATELHPGSWCFCCLFDTGSHITPDGLEFVT